MRIKAYLFNLLISVDQFANTALGGDPDETISSRAHKAKLAGKWWGQHLCNLLNWLDSGHCEDSVEWDEGNK